MANPFRTDTASMGSRSLNVGETRQINVKDKDGDLIETITLHRTARPYVWDLADAYNSMKNGQDDRVWIVGDDKNLKLQSVQAPKVLTEAMEADQEVGRQKWLHRHRHPERYVGA